MPIAKFNCSSILFLSPKSRNEPFRLHTLFWSFYSSPIGLYGKISARYWCVLQVLLFLSFRSSSDDHLRVHLRHRGWPPLPGDASTRGKNQVSRIGTSRQDDRPQYGVCTFHTNLPSTAFEVVPEASLARSLWSSEPA